MNPLPNRPFLTNVFLSPDEPRLRAGWRLAIHTIGYNLLLICITVPLTIPILFLEISPDNLLLNQAIALFAITPSVFLARQFLDKRSLTSLGLKLDVWIMLDHSGRYPHHFFDDGIDLSDRMVTWLAVFRWLCMANG